MLPLGPTGRGTSPYGTASAFAGNPLLISPELLVAEGLLPSRTLEEVPRLSEDRVEWDFVRPWKETIFRAAWSRASEDREFRAELEAFREAREQRTWLPDWSLFAALSERYAGDWPADVARRDPAALASARRELEPEIAYHAFLQLLFRRQWDRVRKEAHRRGISIFGDVPIYVPGDSADVWARPELFDLDDAGRPIEVAGVPPDFFSETGQLWGYPLYRWDRMEEDGFAWWIERFRQAFRLADVVRLDHFRGFAGYWAVPAGDETAAGGQWRTGPGRALFDAVREELGDVAFVAEDLGTITPDVRRLLADLALPGMKVLQFAFYGADSPDLPHRHVPESVAYTGTHDNDTVRGWWSTLTLEEKGRVYDYLGSTGHEIEWDLIRAVYASVSDRAVVPVQDVFGLSGDARMNNPALASGNWGWRARAEDFRPDRADRLARMARLAGRGAPPVEPAPAVAPPAGPA